MIYLKSYNENIDNDQLKDLCDMCLAYLIDDYYTYEIKDLIGYTQKVISIKNDTIVNTSTFWPKKDSNFFRWKDIKNQFIPFLEVLSKKYEVTEVKMNILCEFTQTNTYSGIEQRVFLKNYLSTLINDRFDDEIEIKDILIIIDKKVVHTGFISKFKSLFESIDIRQYKLAPVEIAAKLKSLPDEFKVKVRPILHKISGIPSSLEVTIRKPRPNNLSRSINYNINEVLPAIEEVKELLDGRYKLVGINGDYYHGILSQYDNQDVLIDFVTNQGRVNSGKYVFIFNLITFETKKIDDDLPLDEIFACCSDEGIRITKKNQLGFLSINVLLNEVSHYDERFRFYDDLFYRQVGDAIHQLINFYKFNLVYISMEGATKQNSSEDVIFNSGMKFKTLDEWEALPKEGLTLSRISINFEL